MTLLLHSWLVSSGDFFPWISLSLFLVATSWSLDYAMAPGKQNAVTASPFVWLWALHHSWNLAVRRVSLPRGYLRSSLKWMCAWHDGLIGVVSISVSSILPLGFSLMNPMY